MGVMLELYIDFSKINSKQWENVYNESLKLIDSYEFMDIITGKEKIRMNLFMLTDQESVI